MAKVVYLLQMLPTFGGRCNRYFWDIRLKMLRLANFNMLFQLAWTKFFKSELFSCLPPVGHVIKSCKEPILLFSLLHLLIFFSIFFHPQIHRPYINPTSTLDSTFFVFNTASRIVKLYTTTTNTFLLSPSTTTTTFLNVFLHYHISIIFPPPPPPHFYCFPPPPPPSHSYYFSSRQVIWVWLFWPFGLPLACLSF